MPNKKSVSRVDRESEEGLAQVTNQVPENKYQTTQQVADTEDALNTKGASSSFTAKTSKVKGATLKQQAIADVITGSGISAGMGISGGGRGVSGTSGGILGANNSTPSAKESRDKTRVGKKLDRTATKLNYTPCEQVYVEVDESKPLALAEGDDQGYNGTYRNENARSQKVMGAVPGDLMFQRSVDLITKDNLYFVEGQQVFQVAEDRTGLNPTKSCFNEENAENYHDVEYTSGNFLHRALRFGLEPSGDVEYFVADVEDLTPNIVVNSEIANGASAHRLIKSNVAELDRQVMDTKAGDEKADIWSPLPRAVKEPTRTSYLLSSIEAETGAYAYLAYSKATTNMAYQLNRGPKDGLDEIGPAIDEVRGSYENATNSDYYKNSTYNSDLGNVFKASQYAQGSPALMIEAYDSKAKYHNKADLLLQPRGWRMHLQTADNNINPLKVPAEFASVFTGQETFSTIDHDYDPTLPICMTDKTNLITVHNFNELAGFTKFVSGMHVTYSTTKIADGYESTDHTLLKKNIIGNLGYEHIYVYYRNAGGTALAYNGSTGEITWAADGTNVNDKRVDIIVTADSTVPEGYTLVATYDYDDDFDLVIKVPKVQSGTTVVTKANVSVSKSILYHAKAGVFAYSYSDLRNVYVVTVKHPLIEGMIQYLKNSIGGKMYELLKSETHELFIPMIFSTQYMTLAQLFICAATPWIVRERINSMKDIIYYEDNLHEYPFSKLDSIAKVPFHNYVNFGFNGYDEPLEVRQMNPVVAIKWIMPEFMWKVGSSKYVLPWYFNENECKSVSDGKIDLDASAMSFPSIRSGIRLGALDTLYGMSEKDVRLSLDRLTKYLLSKETISTIATYKYGKTTDGQPYVELSDSDVFTMFDLLSCPRELGLCMDAPYGLFEYESNVGTSLDTEASPSFVIKIWTNPKTPKDPSILGNGGVNIDRAANYVQKWYALKSSTANSDTNLTGLVFGMNDEGAATYKPYCTLGSVQNHYTDGPDIISLQRSLWTRLQMLPFVLSPFDGHATSGSGVRDIYDIAYMFGLAGFRASDYRESVYNREKEAVNQGLLFVSDPWIEASPIVKNGSLSAGISISKGYEVKRA